MPQPEFIAEQFEILEKPAAVNGNGRHAPEPTPFINAFKAQTANAWQQQAAFTPTAKKLFGEFWFEDEVCICFSSSNAGKSLLAVQIGEALASGKPLGYFENETKAHRVLYFDFEQSYKQFELRYSERDGDFCTNHYVFSDNFFRCEVDKNALTKANLEDFEAYIHQSLEHTIAEIQPQTVIVDNLTWLRRESEQAKHALILMQTLQITKDKFGGSMLVLAHTPKRDLTRPITENDLAGSKNLMNFANSSFAIGKSASDVNTRYIKQIKVRNTGFQYAEDNVAVCQIDKPNNFTGFQFLGFSSELEHLKALTDKDKKDLIDRVCNLHEQGHSNREIAGIVGIAHTSVARYLKKAEESEVE